MTADLLFTAIELLPDRDLEVPGRDDNLTAQTTAPAWQFENIWETANYKDFDGFI
jgi:hypothetical protein